MFADHMSWVRPALLGAVLGFSGMSTAFAAASSELAEMAAVRAAPIAPSAAITAAEAKAGGRAVDFGFESNSTMRGYEVTVATGSGLDRIVVDPVTGATTPSAPLPTDALAGDGLPAGRISQAASAPVSLQTGIAAAEQAGGGRALEGNYVFRQGRFVIDVDVVGKDGTHGFTVDATTGKLVQSGRTDASGKQASAAHTGTAGDNDGEQDND